MEGPMASIASAIALSHVEGITDSQRERELYKYYQPSAPVNADTCFPSQSEAGPSATTPEDVETTKTPIVTSNIASSKISSPDTALTAFCQLVTWRTGLERAMISLIDSKTQYFIAESTKTVDLVDNTQHAPGDEIWMGCGSVSKAGRLCERTIAVDPTENGYPCFIVNDLTQDERFNELPFVTGSPFLKFYAGVPLITQRGIPIGSLFVVDSRVRQDLSPLEVHFMGTMAKTIMKHLEMSRGMEEHRRGMKMSRGLALFVEGRAELAEAATEADATEGTKIAGSFESDNGIARSKSKSGSMRGLISPSTRASLGSIEHKERDYSSALAKTEEAILASHSISGSQDSRPGLGAEAQGNPFTGTNALSPGQDVPEATAEQDMSEESSMKVLFSRASNLIREAFEVDGGAVFYDAQQSFGNYQRQRKPASKISVSHEDSHTSSDDLQLVSEQNDDRREGISPEASPGASPGRSDSSTSPGLGEGMFTRSTGSSESQKTVEILGFSTADASSINGNDYPGTHSFVPFDEKSFHTLLRRYPRGKLWTFDHDGNVSSTSEEEEPKPRQNDAVHAAKELRKRGVRSARAKSDAKFLSMHFPGLRQLLFVPLWGSSQSRWFSGCCVWSTEPTRVLSKQNELAFLTAFCNSVMAECSRIDTEIADQKKGDFIGSISHELRSPLHGILASTEFLGDEVTTGFEKSLVETIDSCGRTLLDTINHILDYSKINHFEKNWRKNRRGSRPIPRSSSSIQGARSDLPMINLFADVDVSVVCEEVVEGVFAGHVFQNVTAQSFDMVPDARGKMSDNANLGLERPSDPDVVLILDMDVQNYHFTTQPGAFRRVIMNLLGNALKYTSHGYVRMMLEAVELEDLQVPGTTERIPRSMVTVTISDTGKGISSEFLRTKLFTAFAQENSLSSGTGLGLSIVKSIVKLLEGELTIDSELGRGTQVRVSLPLLRDMPKTADSNSSSTPKSTTSITREVDESISLLRARAINQKVSLHGFDLETKDPVVRKSGKLLQGSITNFLTNWYGLKVVPFSDRASIVILNEATPAMVSKALQKSTINGKAPGILVLCSHSSRFQRYSSQSGPSANVGYVAKPVGPLKLARALMQCLEGAASAITPALLSMSPPESNDLSALFEELSLSPHGGEILDNSRMATDSDNARKAIESPTPNASIEKHLEFPFPIDSIPAASKFHSMTGGKDTLKPLTGNVHTRTSAVLSKMEVTSTPSSSTTGTTEGTPSSSAQLPLQTLRVPSLLLVDDNKINLGLLFKYMMKNRNHEVVETAENGLLAVQKFEQREEGFDIIFMDISMPVLDGFGATKQIRAIEEARKSKAQAGEAAKPPALIVALTGLASSRDQSEAAMVGIDVFITKPYAFKELGKMIDNWQANRERESPGYLGGA